MIAHKLKAIYIHITKTAGSSVEVALDAVEKVNEGSTDPATGEFVPVVTGDAKHMTAKKCKALVGEETWDSYFKFTIVRNPWDRIHSLWWNGRYIGKHHDWPLPRFVDYILERSLQGKVRALVKGRRLRMHQRYWPQSEFLASGNGQIEMDQICYFENLKEDFASVSEKLGLPSPELPRILVKNRNPGTRKFYAEDFDDRSERLITDVYADDIRNFGYQFGK